MTPLQWKEVKERFHEALEQPAETRESFLVRVCPDEIVRSEVARLLMEYSRAGTFLSEPAGVGHVDNDLSEAETLLDSTAVPTSDNIGAETASKEEFGSYKIVRLLGEGGMASVYLAEQQQPIRRQVAIKVIKLGMNTPEVIARFNSERQVLAVMDHPHIARVFDAGATDRGQPYFVMEYVAGVPITEYCDSNRLSNRERIGLFLQVCAAIQHAHQKGVIHRDIKPSNVLVGERDGKPFARVIDFGIAKATDQRQAEYTAFTRLGQLVGTPEYMSPEQAEFGSPAVDTMTDVYSLGVLLYELLVGALPFEGRRLREAGLMEFLRIIREEEPPTLPGKLASLNGPLADLAHSRRTDSASMRRQLAGDLNWIVMKTLEKEGARRYSSASQLAEDIGRYLTDEPIVARPPNAGYRLRKFLRRHKRLAASATAVLVALVAGIIVSTWQGVRATRAEAVALSEKDRLETVERDLMAEFGRRAEASRQLPEHLPLSQLLNFEAQQDQDRGFPRGWYGRPFATIFADNGVVHSGRWSARIDRGTDSPGEFSALTSTFPVRFGGHQIELRGYLRSEKVDSFAGLWLREDSAEGKMLSLKHSRHLRGTTPWSEYRVSLPLDERTDSLAFGVISVGNGQTWADDLTLLIDGKLVPEPEPGSTPPVPARKRTEAYLRPEPLSQLLGFEAHRGPGLPTGWIGTPATTIFLDSRVVHSGRWSAKIDRRQEMIGPRGDTYGSHSSLLYSIPVDFSGRQLEFRGFLRTENVLGMGHASLWMEDPINGITKDSDRMWGTHPWTALKVTMPLDPRTNRLEVGFHLIGYGLAWGDDFALLVDGKPLESVLEVK
jgi:serine/threonine protein kinase